MCAGPTPQPPTRAKAKAARKNPNSPPRPRRVPGLGRHFPPLPESTSARPSSSVRSVLVSTPYTRSSVPCGWVHSAYLIDRNSNRVLSQAGFSSFLPATRYCSLYSAALHSFIRACCRRPPIPHSLLCTFQSNPIQPAVLSFYRPPIPARTSCRASIVSQTLFSSPCAALGPQHPIDCQSSYCPTFCQTSPSGTGDPPAQSSPALPTLRMRDNIKPSPPVIRSSSDQPRPQSTISLKHY